MDVPNKNENEANDNDIEEFMVNNMVLNIIFFFHYLIQ